MSTDILLFGGTGDLALRKLYPAFYYLKLNGVLPADIKIVGVARRANTQEAFLATVKEWMIQHTGPLYDDDVFDEFGKCLTFAQGDSTKAEELKRISDEHFRPDGQLIVYFSVPPSIFGGICTALEEGGLIKPNTRVVVEKPLGNDCASFMAINEEMRRVFNEDQVYRIDHYLGKESVQNLLALRFANDIFQPIWNGRYIDHIQITVSESVGCGNRRDFYEETGAIRDMVQNHLLQVLCLTCIEPPASLDAESVRTEKLKILKCLKPITTENVTELTVRGQYAAGEVDGEQVPGYNEEGDGTPGMAETYVAIKAEVESFRWSGTPIYLRTGKRLNARHAEIVITFKQNRARLFADQASDQCANQLVINLQPDEGIKIHMKNKQAGLDERMPLENRFMDLSFSDNARAKKHDAYTRLLYDVIRGDQTLFVSEREIEAAWDWVDAIRAGWAERDQRPCQYTAGSTGPSEADEFMIADGRSWNNF